MSNERRLRAYWRYMRQDKHWSFRWENVRNRCGAERVQTDRWRKSTSAATCVWTTRQTLRFCFYEAGILAGDHWQWIATSRRIQHGRHRTRLSTKHWFVCIRVSKKQVSEPFCLIFIAHKHTTAMSDNDTTFPSVRVKCRLRPKQSSINQRWWHMRTLVFPTAKIFVKFQWGQLNTKAPNTGMGQVKFSNFDHYSSAILTPYYRKSVFIHSDFNNCSYCVCIIVYNCHTQHSTE